MPYVTQARRIELAPFLQPLVNEIRFAQCTEGDLNYIITSLVHAYLENHGEGPNYARYNAAMGVLECAKLELYRRHTAPYEDTKIAQNGDVP